jgi:hypothetical protein
MLSMDTVNLDAKYLKINSGTLNVSVYESDPEWLAVFVEHADEDGYPEVSTLSVNLTAYTTPPPAGHFYVKDYAENEGVADALVRAGIASKVETFHFGPFDSPFILMKLEA